MRPSILDEIGPQDLNHGSTNETKKRSHYILITWWLSNDCETSRKEIIEDINNYSISFEDSCAEFLETSKGTLSVIYLPVECIFDIDKNNLTDDSHSLLCFHILLICLLYKSVSHLTVSLINKNDNYTIFHQERIYKEDFNKKRCRDLFDKINEFIKKNECVDFKSIYCEIEQCRNKYFEDKRIKDIKFLAIDNKSSSKDIPQIARDLMIKIIKAGRTQFLTQYDCLLPYHEEDPLPIHIYLKNPKDMKDYDYFWKDIEDKEKYKPQGKILGYYIRKEDEIDYPHIVLCPENIEECSGEIYVENLYALVLVHEMSHAILDRYYEHWLYKPIYKDWNIEEVDYWPYSLYSKAMEESLANMMALMWIKSYNDPRLLAQSRLYIKQQQPAIYQFGEYQYQANVDWKKWRNSTKDMISLEKWFKTFFKDGSIIDPFQNDIVLSVFNDVFMSKEE